MSYRPVSDHSKFMLEIKKQNKKQLQKTHLFQNLNHMSKQLMDQRLQRNGKQKTQRTKKYGIQLKCKKWKKICLLKFYFGREEKLKKSNANVYF